MRPRQRLNCFVHADSFDRRYDNPNRRPDYISVPSGVSAIAIPVYSLKTAGYPDYFCRLQSSDGYCLSG
ncbi:MAG: hypothetical protein J07HX5_00101 [halophilic archaeon J07HX5]|nr:MAG: hypothetical protein J07HX5_00101 [halophilic archaeon J07HX5]